MSLSEGEKSAFQRGSTLMAFSLGSTGYRFIKRLVERRGLSNKLFWTKLQKQGETAKTLRDAFWVWKNWSGKADRGAV